MKKRFISCIIIIAVFITILPINIVSADTSDASTTIKIGDYIKLGTYYGESIVWRCVDIDEYGALMLSDKILCLKPFDAEQISDIKTGSHSIRKENASNYWADSNIRSWLNSNANSGEVEWLCGNAPIEEGVWAGYNEYDQEAGFLSNFSDIEKSVIKEVTQKSIVGYPEINNGIYTEGNEEFKNAYSIEDILSNYYTAYAEKVTDSVFLPDARQAVRVYANRDILGDEYYIGKLTKGAATHSEYTTMHLYEENEWEYWLRTPRSGVTKYNGVGLNCINSWGDVSGEEASSCKIGVRPAFYLADNAVFENGDGSCDNPYIVDKALHNNTIVPTDTPQEPTIEPSATPEITIIKPSTPPTLPVFKISGSYHSSLETEVNYITPENGAGIETAEELAASYLIDKGYKNVNKESLNFKEITTKEFWDNTNVQIFLDENEGCIVFISNNTVIGIISMCDGYSLSIYAVYLADINNDSKYEVCANAFVGSGIRYSIIEVFDVQNRENYELQGLRGPYDCINFLLDIDDETGYLTVYKDLSYDVATVTGNTFIGELIISNDTLSVSGFSSSITNNSLPFMIDNIAFQLDNLYLETLPHRNKVYKAYIDILKLKTNDEEDYVLMGIYDKDGALLNLYYEKCDIAIGSFQSIEFDIEPQSKPIYSVKVFVLDDLTTLEPLAETKEVVRVDVE